MNQKELDQTSHFMRALVDALSENAALAQTALLSDIKEGYTDRNIIEARTQAMGHIMGALVIAYAVKSAVDHVLEKEQVPK